MSELKKLYQLAPGQRAVVSDLKCSGPMRSRLMNLGIVEGTAITAELAGPFGDPVAYGVRGALIALRREDSENVLISIE